tara:strand:+ start:6591 stop:7427 length:837 start_codon:yes stop_codon:yes gene_type:complete
MLKYLLLVFLITFSLNASSNNWIIKTNKTNCSVKISDNKNGEYLIISKSGKNKPLSSQFISYLKKYESKYMTIKSVSPVYAINKVNKTLFSKKIYHGFDVDFNEKETSIILNELEKNNFVFFNYITNYNKNIIFKPLNDYEFKKFNDIYKKFKKCNHDLYYYNFNDIKRTIILYDRKENIEPNLKYKKELDKIINYLKESKKEINKIIINSYTDKKGLRENNEYISEKRSKYIRDYLLNSGISNVNYVLNSYGEKRNVSGNSTIEKRKSNRRTIIIIK